MQREIRLRQEVEVGVVVEKQGYIDLPKDSKLRDMRAREPISIGQIYYIGLLGRIQVIKVERVIDDYIQIDEREWEVITKIEGLNIINGKEISYVVGATEHLISNIEEVLPSLSNEKGEHAPLVKELLIKELSTFINSERRDTPHQEGHKEPPNSFTKGEIVSLCEYFSILDIERDTRSVLDKILKDDEYIARIGVYREEMRNLIKEGGKVRATEDVVIDNHSKQWIEREEEQLFKCPKLKRGMEILNNGGVKSVRVELEVTEVEDLIEIRTRLKKEEIRIDDRRIDSLLPGPYYHLDWGLLWEVDITSVYSAVELEENKVIIYTCIDYQEDDNQRYTWYGNTPLSLLEGIINLPPLPQEHLHLFFHPSSKPPYIRQTSLLRSNEVTPLNYPFKYYL